MLTYGTAYTYILYEGINSDFKLSATCCSMISCYYVPGILQMHPRPLKSCKYIIFVLLLSVPKFPAKYWHTNLVAIFDPQLLVCLFSMFCENSFIYLNPLDLITLVCENKDCNQWIPTHDGDDDNNNIILFINVLTHQASGQWQKRHFISTITKNNKEDTYENNIKSGMEKCFNTSLGRPMMQQW